MHYSASRVKGLSKITDKRKARGKLYRIETVMMIIVVAKLSGEDKPNLAGSGSGLSLGKTIPMVAQWTLLPNIL